MAIGGDDDIDIKVSLRDEASRPADRAADSIDKIKRAAIEAAPAVNELEQQIEQEGAAARKAAAENEAYAKSTKAAGREAATAGRDAGNGSKGIDKMTKSMKGGSKAGSVLMGVLKYGIAGGAIIDGVGQLSGMVSALGAAGIGAVNGLAPLGGMLAAYPGYLAAIGQGYGAVKLAFGGMGEALKQMSDPDADPEKLAAAMKGITKEGKSMLKYVLSLKKPWQELQKDAQRGFMPGAEAGIRRLYTKMFPTLRKELVRSSSAMGATARDFSIIFGSPKNVAALGRVMTSNTKIMRGFGKDAGHGLGIFLNLLDASRPMLQGMSKDLGRFLARFDKMSSSAKNKRGLTNFLSDSYSLFKKTLAISLKFGRGIINLFKASAPMSKYLGDGIETIATNFERWTGSADGQKKMQQFFEKMIPVTDELFKILWDLGKVLFDLGMDPTLIDNLKSIRTEFLPALSDFAKMASGKFVPAILDILTNITKIASKGDAFSPLAGGLQAAAAILGVVADLFDKLPDSVSGAILTFGLFALAANKLDISSKIQTGVIGPMGRLKGAGGIGGLKAAIGGAGSGLLGLLGGPWGAAFTIAGTVLGHFISKTQEAKKMQDDLRNSLDQATGAVTEQTKVMIGKSLQESGGFKIAEQFGIDKGTLINAAAGDKVAAAQITAQYREIMKGYQAMVDASNDPRNTSAENLRAASAANDMLANGIMPLQKMLNNTAGLSVATQGAVTKQKELADAVKASKTPVDKTAAAVDNLNGKYVKLPSKKNTQVAAPGTDAARAKVDLFHTSLNKTPNNKSVNVTVSGIQQAILQTQALQRQIDSLRGKTVGVHYAVGGRSAGGGTNTGGGITAQAEGGWARPGMMAMVNERGPEAFIDMHGRISALGTGTPFEVVQHDRAGYVVPNEILRGVKSAANLPRRVLEAVSAANGSMGRAGAEEQYMAMPKVDVHVGSIRDETDLPRIKRLVKEAVKEADKERRERR